MTERGPRFKNPLLAETRDLQRSVDYAAMIRAIKSIPDLENFIGSIPKEKFVDAEGKPFMQTVQTGNGSAEEAVDGWKIAAQISRAERGEPYFIPNVWGVADRYHALKQDQHK